jgi:hypothetical protein
MKKRDAGFVLLSLLIVLPFLPLGCLRGFQSAFLYNESWWLPTSFLKFALLATLGEVLGLRIKTGHYNAPGFGILPRAVVWGFLGITIKIAFVLFAAGVPVFLEKYCALPGALDSMKMKDILEAHAKGAGGLRLLTAFSISALMNLIYAPLMMTLHRITDTHITEQGGTLAGLLKPMDFGRIFANLNWRVQWDFVFKRTIPLFWIPAHTVTFLLPAEYRLVMAAFLGIALGVILSLASLKGRPLPNPS